MAAGDKVQVGRAFKVEFGSATWAGRTLDSLTNQYTSDLDTQPDERGADIGYIFSNPGQEITLNCRIEDTGSITPITPGTIVSITPPGGSATNFIVLAASPVNHSSGVTTQTVTFVRKDSMASTLDA